MRRTKQLMAIVGALVLLSSTHLPAAAAVVDPHAARPVLSLGDRGDEVKSVQQRLRVAVDGRYGARTHAAVMAFQRVQGLTADGVVGPRTWSALEAKGPVAKGPVAISLMTASVDAPARIVGARSYTVTVGDSWASIARAARTTATALTTANRMPAGSPPVTGSRIQVPGAWRCPVEGGGFSDDYGLPRPDSRVHEGNDLFAPRGTPVRAPVSGRAVPADNTIGGTAVRLYGMDGHRYYFAHLDRAGAIGQVTAGTAIGFVGNSGNAVTTPTHLHFEIHPDGGAAVNPYPTITLACQH